MAETKTGPSSADVRGFLEALEHPTRRADGLRLLELFTQVTGYSARMWGPSIVGFGKYHYVYDSGREGETLATGFSPRKASLSIYIMPGYQDYGEILGRLGKHKKGKACLYVNKLADVDEAVLAELIEAGLRDLGKLWPVSSA